jgi:chlorobactene glucosyltransferase
VSLLVPARDEARVIQATVTRLLRQDYPDFELIVLDDASTDGTAALAIQAGQGDRRLQVIGGNPLPAGWTGKNWACQQLGEMAKGELLVFTDADVAWSPGALRAVVACIQATRADTFTVWPTQQAISREERLVVPLMMYTITSYLPEIAVRKIPWASFAAANGQCLAFRRPAYQALGGHAAVRQVIVEDIALAQLTKRAGLRLVMALGNGQIYGRMYQNWRQVRAGFAKNILAGHGGQPVFLIISAIFHWLIFIVPWIWLATGIFITGIPGWPEYPLAMIALGLGSRLLSAATTRHALPDALLMPVSVVLMTVIAAQSLWWHFTQGGPSWKGRVIPTSQEKEQV